MMQSILLVEDDLGIRETVSDLITTMGYQASEVENGVEALEAVRSHPPDLIISDIMMPQMNGSQLLARLKADKRFCTIPVIILTAKTDYDTKLDSYRIGADGYLTKPFNIRELSYKIKNLINLKENLLKSEVEVEHTKDPEWVFIQKLNGALEHHMDATSLHNISRSMQLSPSGLQKKLKKYSSQSFQDYVRIFKLSKGKALLESGDCNVSEAASRSGFKSISSFSKSFKEQFGSSPKELIY